MGDDLVLEDPDDHVATTTISVSLTVERTKKQRRKIAKVAGCSAEILR